MLIYLITDRQLRPDLPLPLLISSVARAGADMIQLREKDLSGADLLECALRVREESGPRGAELFVNGRVDVALAAGAAGVHLPASGLPAAEVRARWGHRLRIGVSAHNLAEAIGAREEGADFITFGPVFETASKVQYGPPVGVERLKEAVAQAGLPVFAIGGINRSTIARLAGIPLAGVAVISAVIGAADMGAVVEELRGAIS
ncbi:MAG TPA: thiamine phosphate synthase [Patescibacteria group bacterium]|nr:thiamine phosphate synthase [Patescibacteria group bacterium]